MSYDVRFSRPQDAMRHAMAYNGRGVRLILKEARQAPEPWPIDCFRFAFSFAGIQGYPVTAFYERMKAKGLAT